MEHTYALIRKAQAGDVAAKEQLVEENARLIWSVVRRFHGRGEAEDLFQIGTIGLLKCIEKFNFAFDVKFSTYAVPMILGEIKRFLRDDGQLKVSRGLKELAYRARRLQEQILAAEDREPTIQELAGLLEVEKEELLLALEAGREVESLYAPVAESQSGEHPLQLIDRLTDPSQNEKMLNRLSLKEALEHLDAKERQIILLRYFHDRKQSDVAKVIGISQVQVSRIEKKILSRMREALRS